MRRHNPILGTYAERIARVFAKRDGITVRIEGSGAPCALLEENTIVIPETIDHLDPESRQAFEGVLDHEVAHLRAEGDFPDAPLSGFMRVMDKRSRWMLNVVEDVRIELDAESRWTGVKDNLEACARWAYGSAKEAIEAGKANAGYLFGAGLIARGRGWGEHIECWPDESVVLLDEFQWAIEEARETKSPTECADLAERILKALDEMEMEAPEEPEEETGEGGEGFGDEDGEGDSESEPGEGDIANAEAREVNRAIAASSDEMKTPAHEVEIEVAVDAKKAAMRERGGVPSARPEVRRGDRRVVLTGARGGVSERFREECSRYVGGLSSRLAMLLRAPTPRNVPDQESGMLDAGVLASVKTGNRRVFERDVSVIDKGTAVAILVDCSGSMYGESIAMAERAAFVLAEALSRAGIKFEVTGWTESGGDGGETPEFSRNEHHVEYVVKEFGESWRRVRGRTEHLHDQPLANNDDAQAVWCVARRLLQQREARKILIVLSDGEPAHYITSGFGARQQLRDVLGMVEAAGIETAGIGILTSAVEHYYENHSAVNRLADLPKACIAVLGRTLRRRAA